MQRETEREIIIIFFVEFFDGTSENLLHSLICFVYAFIFGRFIFHSFRIVKLTNHFSPISDEVMANTYTARRRRESNRKCLFHCLESALGENSEHVVIKICNVIRFMCDFVSVLLKIGVLKQLCTIRLLLQSFSEIKYSFIGRLVSNYVIFNTRRWCNRSWKCAQNRFS